MLKIRVKDIPPEGKHRLLRLDAAWFVETMAGVEGSWAEAVGEIPVSLSRTGSEVLARGEVRARFTLPCARCLETAIIDVRAPFATTFVPAGAGRAAAADEDPDIEAYEGDEIDLQELAREQVLLAIPMSALCRSDCQGLCPQCGKELNLGPCGCPSPTGSLGEALNLKKAARAR
jgi:uncharacterized metal-binding protein YceD (DUF177 family)